MIEDLETVDLINEQLETFADRLFHSIEAAEKTIGDILSQFDIDFDGGLSEDEDNIFKLETANGLDSNYFLYVIIESELVGFCVFAQIVDEEDLSGLMDDLDDEEYNEMPQTSDFLKRVRRSADD